MKTRELGRSGLQVSTIGLGCMGISFSYATKLPKDEGVALIRAAVERGVTLPSNLQGLYRCEFEGDRLEYDATMKLLKTFSQFN